MKKKVILSMVIIILILVLPLQTKAVLQANPNTNGVKADTNTNWMTNIRNMETLNQAMGLQETIDATTKKATSSSNNIDVHMIKTTEWGAVAILSASGYGNSSVLQTSTIKSTTGNKSGVYFPLAYEWTAGGLEGSIFSGVDAKYYDSYTTSTTSAKAGDALGTSTTINPGCAGWHSSSFINWVMASGSYFYFIRGENSLYSFRGREGGYNYLCRAVVVCGEGF